MHDEHIHLPVNQPTKPPASDFFPPSPESSSPESSSPESLSPESLSPESLSSITTTVYQLRGDERDEVRFITEFTEYL